MLSSFYIIGWEVFSFIFVKICISEIIVSLLNTLSPRVVKVVESSGVVHSTDKKP